MQLTGLTDFLRDTRAYRQLLDTLKNTSQPTRSVVRAARPFLLAALAQDWHAPVLYLTDRGRRAYNVTEQLPVWLPDARSILQFAEPTPMFYDRLPWEVDVIQARLASLAALQHFAPDDESAQTPVIIVSARALMQRTLSPKIFMERQQRLCLHDRIRMDKLIEQWVAMGYEPVTMVVSPGTFSRRGGLLDIYPVNATFPVRVDFFDDEIDTLRHFNPADQLSTQRLEEVTIIPAREVLPDLLPAIASEMDETHSQDAEAIEQGTSFPAMEHYLPFVYADVVSLLDYAPPETLILLENREAFEQRILDWEADALANRDNNLKTQQLSENHPVPYVGWDTLAAKLSQFTVLNLQSGDIEGEAKLFAPGARYGGQLKSALTKIRKQRNDGDSSVIITQQPGRIRSLWHEQDASEFIPKLDNITEAPDSHLLAVLEGAIAEGWSLQGDAFNLHVLSDAELFNWSRPEPRRRKNSASGRGKSAQVSYADWKEGEYVVHIDYGVGKFAGLTHRSVEGHDREYLKVEYAANDLIFVPVHQSDRLTRYVSTDEKPPKLNRPGKPQEWKKTKEKARKAAEEEAKELLAIYAKRAKASGHAYSPDSAWQYELEASFPYVETEDQLRVLQEVKRDMEDPEPMDRLVCGDVGYGKTEIALRAAFKAVMDHKQVAILVPTTVLASQHFETFKRRMEPFPIKVEMLSRFRTKAQQAQIVDMMAQGEVDIIIGTHRLLSSDIKLNDLGMIIIDEEQRFGVKHKEHFKKLRAQVDILTLTATPIPRTLYMSLAGVRDISMIQTPPEERLPVITHVGSFDEKLARQAILRELDRGGQVFVIHNRVKTIDNLKKKLEDIVPEASVVVAHGQMSGRMLENVISEFSHGTYDILLATSIIENGIDMPNVNTLIVDRADWFGMSQLYQIRGRVGRGAQQAYCYFFHARGKVTEEAQQRLDTLAEHSDLGAGFQVAVRDMEIRGTGDILSTRQSGNISSVGLNLYTQLLQQSVSRLKTIVDMDVTEFDKHMLDDALEAQKKSAPPISDDKVIIDLPISAYLPTDWIPEMSLRLQLYRRMGDLKTLDDVDEMERELIDRFGRLPIAVEGLLYQFKVKILGAKINATGIQKPRGHILIKLPWLAAVNRRVLGILLNRGNDDIDVTRTEVQLKFDEELWQLRLLDVLKTLQTGLPQQVGV